MCPALPQDSAPTISFSKLISLKPSFMTSMCGGVQFTCWTRPSLMARSFPAGCPGPTVKSSWALAQSIPAPSPWCSTREQMPSHPSTMWCSTTNSPPSVPTKTPCPTSTPTCGPSSLVTVPSSLSSMTNLRRMLLTSPMKRTTTPPPSTTIDAQPSWPLVIQSHPSLHYQFRLPLRLLSLPTHPLPPLMIHLRSCPLRPLPRRLRGRYHHNPNEFPSFLPSPLRRHVPCPRLPFAPHSHLLSFPFTLATHGHISSSPHGLISHSAPLSCSPHLRSSEGASDRSPPPLPSRAQARDPIDVGPQQEVLCPHRDIGTPLH